MVVDHSVLSGHMYWYRLIARTADGARAAFGPVQASAIEQIKSFALANVHPNPTPGPMSVDFTVAREARVSVTLHDIQGRQVGVLAEGTYRPGRYEAKWDAAGRSTLPAGLYFVRYHVDNQEFVKRVAIAR